MMITDADMVWRRVNRALCRLLDRPRSELEGATFLDVTHPDDVGPGRAEFQKLRDGQIDHIRQEKRYLRRDGTSVWVLIHAMPIRVDGATPSGYYVIAHNIDPQRRAELELSRTVDYLEARLEDEASNTDKVRADLEATQRELASSRERLRAIAEAMPDMVVRVQRDGTILDIAGFLEIAPEAEPSEIIGRTVQTVLPTRYSLQAMDMIAQVLNSGEPGRLGFEMAIGDEAHTFEARFVRCADDEVLAVIRPISEMMSIVDW